MADSDSDRIMDVDEVAEHLRIEPAEVKKAWREGRLRGARFRKGYRFRLSAVNAFLQEEEERWHERNIAGRGSTRSPDAPHGTSTGTTTPPDGSDDEALVLKIAAELKKASGSSSSSAPKGRSPARFSPRIVTP